MSKYQKITERFIEALKLVLPEAQILAQKEVLAAYSHDETEDLSFLPELVLKPETTEQVANIAKLCFDFNIPMTPQGARTGLSGGALPIFGGVALSLEKLNTILEIDTDNLQVTVQPGVIVQELQETVAKLGLFYPPDPSSKGSCFIGGNIAENAGGPKAVKYGVTKDYVLNLEVVLADGTVIWTGANVLKNATGYNLTQLIVGSEGTLGIVTKAVLKLIPLPKYDRLLLVPFNKLENATKAVAAIFKAGITPSGLEFMERDAIDWTIAFMGESQINIEPTVAAHLLIEVDGNNESVLMSDLEQILTVVEGFECGEVLFAEDQSQKDKLWQIRRKVGEAVKSQSVYKEEDTVVPRYYLPELLLGVKAIGAKYGFKSVCYGHAGDGNLHINIIKGNLSDQFWNETLTKAIEDIFNLTVKLGGTISGEHGIGYVQKNYMTIPFNGVQLKLMQQIKNIFDPKGLLNPGKIFPD
ncbi:MAG: FAD-linked oxidase C-terminal domain-containing protein [Putridiphycobacter sp.]|nr:FAD-linked oxidase C-terminal domain-containing protein [Putridiphycobacter sp.]